MHHGEDELLDGSGFTGSETGQAVGKGQVATGVDNPGQQRGARSVDDVHIAAWQARWPIGYGDDRATIEQDFASHGSIRVPVPHEAIRKQRRHRTDPSLRHRPGTADRARTRAVERRPVRDVR